ncbi:MAG: hypothetical protein Q7U54_20535 [Bacteroidales bacterium]|nr:hypothetical protein [Bacteroidales bacterium]
MKNILLLILMFSIGYAVAQTKPASRETKPSQSEIDKMMEDATKGMSAEEKAEIEKMMKGVMSEVGTKPGSAVVPFTDNKKLVPVKDLNRINRIPKKVFTDADVNTNTAFLYSKLMAKISAPEKAIITGVLQQSPKGSVLMEAAIISFMQGHNEAAMGLALKAVQAEPKNANHQNNLAAILSQSGYPEKAIPYLKKISAQYPSNSTVLHNMGYAWLSLGQIDSAQRLFAYAAVRNPNNPETKLCRGVIEEIKGDPKKAADNYVESFEDVPNPFTEDLAKNVKADGQHGKMDFDKMKSRIVIYEYFKKDWIVIPALSDNVSAYEKNSSIKNGYSKMFEELNAKLGSMAEASSAEIKDLADKGVVEFTETMMNESIKGINMMSKPAAYVQIILDTYVKEWIENYQKEGSALMEKINKAQMVMTKIEDNDKCPDTDRKNNEFLVYANPLIRKFNDKKNEEFRVWLNAFCTWRWYITGNPQNTVMTECIGWTAFLAGMYQSAIDNQYALEKACIDQKSDGALKITVPTIPNFTCPAVVTFPVGMDEMQLGSETTNFDNNDWDIKQAEGTTMPNVTLSMGVDKNDITEPGKYGNPYVKTGNGSINASGINCTESDDNELMPLSKILDELASLPVIPSNELAPLNPAYLNNNKKLGVTDYKKMRNAELARKLLKEMMKTKCPGELPVKKKRKDKFEVGLGELVLDPLPVDEYGIEEKWDPEMKAWVNSKGEYRFESGLVVRTGELVLDPVSGVGLGQLELDPVSEVGLGELKVWDDEMQAYINSKGEKWYEDGFKDKVVKDVHDALEEVNKTIEENSGYHTGDLEMWDDDMQAWITPNTGDVRYEDGFKDKLVQDVKNALETSGLQTTIVNGLEGIKAMGNTGNGLFE